MTEVSSLPAPADVAGLLVPAVRPSAGAGTPDQPFGLLPGRGPANWARGDDARFHDQISASSTDLSLVLLAGLRLVPGSIAHQRVIGQVTAQNRVTGDCITWNVSAALKRAAANGPLAWIGPVPTVSVYAADPAMSGCLLSLNLGANALTLTGTGLAATDIAWTGTLTVSGT